MYRVLAVLFVLALLLATLPVAAEPDKTPKPINLEKLNTAADEDDPHLASNGLTLYYASNAAGKFEVLVAHRSNVSQPWAAGKPLADVNSKADTRSPFLTPEGVYPQRLWFATTKDLDKKDQRGNNYDLYFLTKQNAQAEFTFEQGFPYCTPDDELHPWLTPDGKLYFSRKTKEGWRVFVSVPPKGGGQLMEPKAVDLPADFHHATLTPDGKTMYLEGPLEKNRWGLFHSTWSGNAWSKPEPLDDLNDADAPTGEHSPSLSRDGALLYFASDRAGGKGGLDLWVVHTAELKK
jgi:WD40-like Beta Propeller Repeat